MDHNTTAHQGIEGSESGFRQRRQPGAPSRILPHHEEALARLEYVTARQRGFALLTGPAGSGKTVLLREFADGLRHEAVVSIYADACNCGETELWRTCCDALGLACSAQRSAAALRSALLDAIRGRATVGTPVVLILDHADRGGEGAVRLIERLLHATQEQAGPTVVAASREPESPPLARIARDYADLRIQLSPLTADDTGHLIEALCGTGDRHAELTPEAVSTMHTLAGGELRKVNRLWRLLQTAAVVDQTSKIDARMVDSVACELPR
jgi:general secretion pathway protein A